MSHFLTFTAKYVTSSYSVYYNVFFCNKFYWYDFIFNTVLRSQLSGSDSPASNAGKVYVRWGGLCGGGPTNNLVYPNYS